MRKLALLLFLLAAPFARPQLVQLSIPAVQGLTPGSYTCPTTTVDAYGRVTQIAAGTCGGSALPVAMQGLNTYLPFTDGSGLIITDKSGNSHNATLTNGGTGSWTPQGYTFGSESATISANAGLPTYGICARFPAAPASSVFTTYNYYFAPVYNSTNGTGMGTSYGGNTGHSYMAYFPQITPSTGGTATSAVDGFTGNHCIEFVVGTTNSINDRIYSELGEVTYLNQGSSSYLLGGSQLANAITLSANAGNGLTTTIYSVWNATTADTPAIAMARLASEKARLQALGVKFGIPAVTSTRQTTQSQCAIQGTSIDAGFQASQPPYTLLSLDFPCNFDQFAVSSQASRDMDIGVEDREATVFAARAGKNITFNGGPTNGLTQTGESVADAVNDIISWSRKNHAIGFKTIASTMLSRSGTGTGNVAADTLAQQFNALLLANGDEFDWLDNVAAVPVLGATGAYNSTTYFADGTHPTNTGQAFYVAAMRAGFEGVYGNPNPKLVTANYTQLDSDRLLLANSGSAFTVTLKDANYASFNKAGKLCVHNIGAGTVTLAGAGGETIDGASTQTISTSATACVIPFVANPAAGGANWIRSEP